MKKFLYVLLLILLLSPSSIYAEEISNQNTDIKEEKNNIQMVVLEECVDGDTAKFRTTDNKIIKARFLAIDTPETVHPTKGVEPFGKEASEYTCTTLTNAKEIKLEYDQNSKVEDNYGRKLVWVFTDNVLLQDSLISKGYAEVAYLYGDYKYTSLLQDSEAIAKANKLGIWSIEEAKEQVSSEKQENSTKSETEDKGFLNSFINSLLGAIVDFINDLLESILKSIEDML